MFAVASGGRGALDADASECALERFSQSHVAEVVLVAFGDFEGLLQFHGAFLEIVVVDEVCELVFESRLASLQSHSFPVLLLAFCIFAGGW